MHTSLFADYTQQYYYPAATTADEQALTFGMVVFAIAITIFVTLAVYAAVALLLARIFKKAGVPTWKAWVPIYNNWITLELGGQKGYWAVLAVVPVVSFVSIVFMYMAMYKIGLKLGKEGAFVLWAIFIPLVWYIWLAVDKSTWQEDTGEQPAVPTHKVPKQTA